MSATPALQLLSNIVWLLNGNFMEITWRHVTMYMCMYACKHAFIHVYMYASWHAKWMAVMLCRSTNMSNNSSLITTGWLHFARVHRDDDPWKTIFHWNFNVICLKTCHENTFLHGCNRLPHTYSTYLIYKKEYRNSYLSIKISKVKIAIYEIGDWFQWLCWQRLHNLRWTPYPNSNVYETSTPY